MNRTLTQLESQPNLTVTPEVVKELGKAELREITARLQTRLDPFRGELDLSKETKQIYKKLAKQLPSVIFTETKSPQSFVLDNKTQEPAKELSEPSSENTIVKLWNTAREMQKQRNSLLPEFTVYLFQLIDALDHENFVQATRITVAALVTFPDKEPTRYIHNLFADLLKLTDYPRDYQKSFFQDAVNWVKQYLIFCQPDAFAGFAKERKLFFDFLQRDTQAREDFTNIYKALKQPVDSQQHKDRAQRQERDRQSAAQLSDIGTWAQETEAEKRARVMQELLADAGFAPGEPKPILPDFELTEINKRSATPTP